jgi:hypothetical protein
VTDLQPLSLRLRRVGALLRLEIANVSQAPVRIWTTNFSLGYFSICLVVSPPARAPCTVKRKPARWTVNVPEYVTIKAGDVHGETLDPHDGTWDKRQCHIDPPSDVDVTAVLEITPDEHTARYQVVTGRFESNTLRIPWSEIADG